MLDSRASGVAARLGGSGIVSPICRRLGVRLFVLSLPVLITVSEAQAQTASSVLTRNCCARTHAAAALSRAARARLILSRIAAPSARQTYGFGSAFRWAR